MLDAAGSGFSPVAGFGIVDGDPAVAATGGSVLLVTYLSTK
jgi:hypothetical protein